MAYIANTPEDVRVMLGAIGLDSLDQLFDMIPAEYRLRRPLAIPEALSELELTTHIGALAAKNQGTDVRPCFLGGGSYDHFIPAVVDNLAARGEFYTAYTPYQAEASQGTLQATFRVSDPDRPAHRDGHLQRQPLRRRLGRLRGRLDGDDGDPPAGPGRGRRDDPPRAHPDPPDQSGEPRARDRGRPAEGRRGRPRRPVRRDHRRHGRRGRRLSQLLRPARRRRSAGQGREGRRGAGDRLGRPDQPGLAPPARHLRGRHRRGRGGRAWAIRSPMAGLISASSPAARRSSARCPAGWSARRWTATASAASC